MDLIASITWADLLLVLVLAVGALAGFTQGVIRYAAGLLAVLISFVLASQFKAPVADALGFWTAFEPRIRELIVFLFVYALLLAGSWLLIRTVARGTQLPVGRLVDEIGGALLGVLYAALAFVFLVVALASVYEQPRTTTAEGGEAPLLHSFYLALDGSSLIDVAQAVVVPTAGLLVQPFVPEEVRTVLERE